MDPDHARWADFMARYCEAANKAGITIALEFVPYSEARTIEVGYDLVLRTGAPNFGLLVDSLHLSRSGGMPADIAKVDAGRIVFAQICDAVGNPLPHDRSPTKRGPGGPSWRRRTAALRLHDAARRARNRMRNAVERTPAARRSSRRSGRGRTPRYLNRILRRARQARGPDHRGPPHPGSLSRFWGEGWGEGWQVEKSSLSPVHWRAKLLILPAPSGRGAG